MEWSILRIISYLVCIPLIFFHPRTLELEERLTLHHSQEASLRQAMLG